MSIILQNPSLVLESRQSSRHFLKKTHAKTRKNSLNATMKRIRKLSCKPTHHKDSLENSIPKSQTGVETEDEETPLSLISKDSNPNTENKPFLNDLLNRYKTIEADFSPLEFLEKHTITPAMRAKMVDWIVEVLGSFGCAEETFFLAVNLMDRFLWQSKRSLNPSDLHLIGTTSMFLASKYEEANHLRLETLCTSVCYDKFTKEQIKDMEMEMLECLDFNILGPNIYSFVCIILEKANFLEQFNEEKRNLVRELSLYMTKMVYYEYTVIRNHFSTILAASICLVSMKLLSKIEPELNISANIQKIKDSLGLDEGEIINKSNQILLLAKNFERIYQSTNNLKKAHKDLFDQLQYFTRKQYTI